MKSFPRNGYWRYSFGVLNLAFSWTLGLVLGVCFTANVPFVVSWMRLLPFFQVSIVGLFCVLFLPLFLTVLCVYNAKRSAIYFISALKAFILGCCLCGLKLTFSNSAWLIRFLLFFSDSCVNLLLLWLWISFLKGDTTALKRDSIIVAVLALIIGLTDYYLVAPFAASLII